MAESGHAELIISGAISPQCTHGILGDVVGRFRAAGGLTKEAAPANGLHLQGILE